MTNILYIFSNRKWFQFFILPVLCLFLGTLNSYGGTFHVSSSASSSSFSPSTFLAGSTWSTASACGAAINTTWPQTSSDVVDVDCSGKFVTAGGGSPSMGALTISAGTLTISTGITLTCTSVTLSGSGTLTVNGTLFISSGNFAITGGTFTAPSTATGTVTFAGAAQNVPATSFYNLNITGTSNKTMQGNVTVYHQLILTGADLVVGSNTLAIGTGLNGIGISQVSGKITTTSSSNLSFGGGTYSYALGTYLSNTWPVTLNNFTMTSNLATISLGSSQNLTVSGTFDLTAGGNFKIGSNVLTLNGAVNMSGSCFCNQITGSSTSDLTLGGSGAASIYMDLTTTTAGGTNTIRNLDISVARNLTMLSNLRIGGTLTQVSGSTLSIAASTSSQTLTIDGSLAGTYAGSLVGNSTYATLVINGTGALGANLTFSSTLALAGMQINRTSSGAVVLGSNLAVSGNLTMSNGILDVHNNTLDLGTTGAVASETSTNYIWCSNCTATTGKITSSGNSLAASTGYTNLRGLGVDITTGTTAPGTTTINRGFASRSGSALSSGILRWYEITPATNTGLNATMNIKYWASELNSITESTLQLFNAPVTSGSTTWANQGGTVNTSTHAISLSGIGTFTAWTAGAGAATPTITASPTSLSAFSTTYGTASTAQTFTASGTNLSANITITAPTGFEISSGGAYATSLTLTESGGSVSNTTISVRLAATTAVGSTYSGNVALTSAGATTVDVSIPNSTVNKATLTVTADNKTVNYGGAVPTYTATITGYVNSENSSVLGGSPAFSCAYATTTPVSSSPVTITPSVGTLTAANYTFSFVNGAVTINTVTLNITANSTTKCFGQTLSFAGTEFSTSGLLNSDAVTSVTLTSSGASSGATVAGSPYSIIPTAAVGSGLGNYSIHYNNGVLTVVVCNSQWNGGTTDWFTGTNWTPVGVPNACADNVVIPSGLTNYPIVSGADVSVGNVDIAAGAMITLQGQNMNVCGYWNGGSGTNATVSGSGAVIINGSSAQTISGSTQFNILQIDNSNGVSVTRGAIVSIVTGLHLQQGAFDVSLGSMQLLSTAANNNSYIDDFSFGATPGTVTGNIIANRYVPSGGYNQHFISSPLGGVALSQIGASGTDGAFVIPTSDCDETQSAYNSPYGSVFTYVDGHEPSGGCVLGNWRITTVGDMLPGKGYSTYLTGNSTISLTGTANTANISSTGLINSAYPTMMSTKQGAPEQSGWNLVGNPYPSAIDLTEDRTGSNFDDQVQVWQTTGPFSGSWQAYVIGSDPHIIIPPFQAFMVHSSTMVSNLSYPFYQAERTRSVSQSFFRTGTTNTLTLEVDYNGTKDVTSVAFNPQATIQFDPAFDAYKTDGSAGRPTVYSYFDDNAWYSVNTLPSINDANAVPVGLRPEADASMTIMPSGIETFDPTTYIYLEDKQTSAWFNLRNGPYTFNTSISDNQQRFVLHFTPPAIILTQDASCDVPGMINIQQPGTANWNYTVTDVNNVTVAAGMLNAGAPVTLNVNRGVYTLTLTDNNGYAVVKNIEISGVQAVSSAFTASASTAQMEQNITFNGAADNAPVYNWDFGDGATANGPQTAHSYQSEGIFTTKLTVTGASGCVSTTSQVITVTSRSVTGITNLSGNKMNIWSYDNKVFVDFSKVDNVDAEVQLYNVLGQMLSDERFGKSSLYSKELMNLDAAYIIVKVINEDQITTKKVFIANTDK